MCYVYEILKNMSFDSSHIPKMNLIKKKNFHLTLDYTTILQSSKQYGTGTKTEICTNGTRQRAHRETYTLTGTLSLTKEARIYNGEKTAFSISDAGKTGHLHAKV